MSAPEDSRTADIIPRPVSLKWGKGRFYLGEDTLIAVDSGNDELVQLGRYLSDQIKFYTGLTLNIVYTNEIESGQKAIYIKIWHARGDIGIESYGMQVAREAVNIDGDSPAGVFHGIQTLLQLLHITDARTCETDIPAVEVHDYPAFPWRGMHLDVCRHFFPKEFIKKFIDLLAMYKFNTFHWHLTEDQGWRIEIKKYPKLTEIGAWRTEKDGTRYGGFYTQDDIRDIVEYAGQRYITIVPEIELPGHARAALAAYPEYSCTGGPFEVANEWGVFDDVFCPGRDETFAFLEDILKEVCNLFPGVYFHIGGDECPKKRWHEHDLCQKRMKEEGLKNEEELQSYFIKRIASCLTFKSKEMMGWDEIMEGRLPMNSSVMCWRDEKYAIEAAEGHRYVVMTPMTHCYFDFYQAKEGEPKAIGGFLPLETVYEFDPIPKNILSKARRFILGGQGNIWTEYMPNSNHVEYMALPRMCAMAEALWSPIESRDFSDFKNRLKSHYNRFDLIEVWYRPHE
jgi:hexosaminidase